MISWSSMQAMTLTDPPQRPQTSMSMEKNACQWCVTRRRAQVMAAWRSAGERVSVLAIRFTPCFVRLCINISKLIALHHNNRLAIVFE